MSAEQTETNKFLAKDGLWYPSYQEMAFANKRNNDEFLRKKGLLDAIQSVKKATKVVRRRSTSSTSSSTTSGTTARIVTPPPRRSERLTAPEKKRTRRNPPGLQWDVLQELPAPKKAKKTLAKRNSGGSGSGGSRGGVGPRAKNEEFSEKDLQALQNMPDWLDKFEYFLLNVKHGNGNRVVGEANAASVIRQVQKLVAGIGITYHHWKKGIYFKQGVKINLGMDFEKLFDDAVEMENEHGKDLGNGWLLRHPIRKLELFQKYMADKKKRATTKD